MRNLFVFLVFAAFSYSFAQTSYSDRLDDDTFYRFRKSEGQSNITGWIKYVVVKTNDQLKVTYFDSNQWVFHADYVKDVMTDYQNLEKSQINEIALDETNEALTFGSIVFGENWYTYKNSIYNQTLTKNSVPASFFVPFRALLKSSIDANLIESLPQYPNSIQRSEFVGRPETFAALGIPVYLPQLNKDFQTYHNTWSVGSLLVVKKDDIETAIRENRLNSNSILLMDELPHELPPVKGVLVASPSTPLSHIAMMAKTYGYPFAYVKEAFTKDEYTRLNGQTVYFYSSEEAVNLSGIPQTIHDRLAPYKKIPQNLTGINVDFSTADFKNTTDLVTSDVARYGAKAVNFAKLVKRFSYSRHQGAFAMPVGLAQKVLKSVPGPTTGDLHDHIVAELASIQDASLYNTKLKLAEIRELIESAQIPLNILTVIKTELDQRFPNMRVKFRSSSPFEDNKAFNGAGLYESKAIKKDHKLKEINKDYLKVIASLYNDKAYLARREFGFKEHVGSMGILVHPAYVGELARGVALFSKDVNMDSHGAIISGFKGDQLSVVDAPPHVRPEVADVQSYFGRPYVSVKQNTTELPAGQYVLTQEQYQTLFKKMLQFYQSYAHNNETYDYEWKLIATDSDPVFEIKQFRPVPKANRFAAPDNDLFVLAGSHSLESAHFEVGDAIRELRHQYKLSLSGGILEFEPTGTPDISTISIENDGQKNEYQASDLNFQLSQGAWVTDIPAPEVELAIERSYVRGEVPSVYPGTRLNVNISKGRGFRPVHMSDQGDEAFLGSGKFNQDVKETFIDGNVEFVFEGYTRMAGFDKTEHRKITKLTISGLTTDPVVIEDPRSVKYSPAHHNFYWEYGVDLEKVTKMMSGEQKLALQGYVNQIATGEKRYLLITFPRTTDLDEGQSHWEFGIDKSFLRLYDPTGQNELIKKIIDRVPRR